MRPFAWPARSWSAGRIERVAKNECRGSATMKNEMTAGYANLRFEVPGVAGYSSDNLERILK